LADKVTANATWLTYPVNYDRWANVSDQQGDFGPPIKFLKKGVITNINFW